MGRGRCGGRASGGHRGHRLDERQALDDAPEDNMLAVEVGQRVERDEEL